ARVGVPPMDPRLRDVGKDTVRPGVGQLVSLWRMVRYVSTLRRRLRELQPDIVHTNSLKAAIYGGLAGRLARVPVVWHVRDRIAPDYLPRSAVRLVCALASRLPQAVIANSRSTLEMLPQSTPDATTVVSDAVPLRAYAAVIPSPVAMNRSRDPRIRTVRGHSLRVGIVGRL